MIRKYTQGREDEEARSIPGGLPNLGTDTG